MATKTQVIQLRAPRMTGALATRARRIGARGARAGAQWAKDQRHTLLGVGAAAAAGLLARQRTQVPHVRALGVAGTYGLGALLVASATRTPAAQHVATGLLAVAAYEWTRGAGTGESVSGEFDM